MDIRLHYTEYGSGTPLVLLHGNGEDSSYFTKQIEYFAPRYRVIAIDTRGHGQSPRGDAPFTLRQFAIDLYSTVCQMGLSRFSLLGFSDGANIAMYYAMAHSDTLSALILDGGNLTPAGLVPSLRRSIALALQRETARLPESMRTVELLRLMTDEPHIRQRELSAITAPTLVMAGTHDVIRRAHTKAIAASIPGAQCVILPGDHFIARDQSVRFNETAAAFLRTHTANVPL